MSRLLINNLPLFGPEDIAGGGLKTPLGPGGILDELNKNDKDDDESLSDGDELNLDDEDEPLDEEVKDKKDDEDDEEEDKEKDELAELEEELKEPSEEDLELTTPVKKREILAKFPTIFKEFPSLEKSYYRELAYTKLLPTIDDAKEAVQAQRVLENFEVDLKQGKTTDLFKAILKDDPQAFAKLADNYMENLAHTDERAYHHVLGNVTKDIVIAMSKSAKTSENKDLADAATLLYQFMFGDVEWKPKSKLAIDEGDSEIVKERQSLQKERENLETEKYTEKQTDLMEGVNNRIKSVIDSNIDKKAQMTPFVKKNAMKEVQEKLDGLVKADARFQTIVKKLWQQAKENKYSRVSLDKIESAHVSKAKSLLPTVILSVRKEALKTTNSRVRREEPKETISRNSPPSRTKGDQNSDKSKPNPTESSLDFLMRRP